MAPPAGTGGPIHDPPVPGKVTTFTGREGGADVQFICMDSKGRYPCGRYKPMRCTIPASELLERSKMTAHLPQECWGEKDPELGGHGFSGRDRPAKWL